MNPDNFVAETSFLFPIQSLCKVSLTCGVFTEHSFYFPMLLSSEMLFSEVPLICPSPRPAAPKHRLRSNGTWIIVLILHPRCCDPNSITFYTFYTFYMPGFQCCLILPVMLLSGICSQGNPPSPAQSQLLHLLAKSGDISRSCQIKTEQRPQDLVPSLCICLFLSAETICHFFLLKHRTN